MNLDQPVDEVEVTIDDLFIEHYEPPVLSPKAGAFRKSAAMAKRRLPHPTSLLGIVGLAVLGGLILGAGILGYRRLFA